MVLVVDDLPDVRAVLQRLLEQHGFETLWAANASEAVSILQTSTPDVMILDDSVPDQSGVDLLRDLRSDPNLKDVPVIMFSAGQDVQRVELAKRFGASDWLVKGKTERSELIGKVTKLHDALE